MTIPSVLEEFITPPHGSIRSTVPAPPFSLDESPQELEDVIDLIKDENFQALETIYRPEYLRQFRWKKEYNALHFIADQNNQVRNMDTAFTFFTKYVKLSFAIEPGILKSPLQVAVETGNLRFIQCISKIEILSKVQKQNIKSAMNRVLLQKPHANNRKIYKELQRIALPFSSKKEIKHNTKMMREVSTLPSSPDESHQESNLPKEPRSPYPMHMAKKRVAEHIQKGGFQKALKIYNLSFLKQLSDENSGNHLLHLVALTPQHNLRECIQIFCQNDPLLASRPNKEGITPLDLAKKFGHQEFLNLWQQEPDYNTEKGTSSFDIGLRDDAWRVASQIVSDYNFANNCLI